MIKEKIEQLKFTLNTNHKSISSMKIYSNNTPVNDVLTKIQALPKGIRTSAIAVYYALEGHANDNCEVDASQSLIAEEIGLSREYVNFLLGELHRINIIKKIRRGLNKVNHYILTVKKDLVSIINELKELYIQQMKEKKQKPKDKNSHFNDYDQRTYDFDELEKKLLGWTNPE